MAAADTQAHAYPPPSRSASHSHSGSRSGSRGAPSRSYSSSSRPPPVPTTPSANPNADHPASATATPTNPATTAANGPADSSRDSSSSHSRSHRDHHDHNGNGHSHNRNRSQSHSHRRTPSSSSRRPNHNDYESSHVAPGHSQRSASRDRDRDRERDRPPTLPSRGPAAAPAQAPGSASARDPDPSSRPHRRASSRSNTHGNNHGHQRSHSSSRHQRQPDMPSAAAGSNAAPSHGAGRDGHHSSTKQSKSRTTIPTQSGKWILGKTIGAGSMGKVKLAQKEDTGEQVACKIIPRGSTDDGHQSRADKERADHSKEIRTSREAAIVTLLNHPHICGLRDVVRTNYHWYMLFEYVNGGQMLDYIISHGKLKEKQARKFSRQIASALDYCHRNSIVHRDLKIENILISKNGDIKIIDFGLSNLFAPRGHLKTFCGSLYFAAPELLQARAYTGPEVDVWSFGIVLYVLVCGKVPFDDQSMPALHAKIKKGVVDYPSWLSGECKHLISRMLVTDPKQRATMQEVMVHPWMIKGFSGPPDNYLPTREPLMPPMEAEVIQAMQGFNFGSPESIQAQLLKIVESEEYQRAVKMYHREKETPQAPREGEKKRGFGLDFYKRRSSQHSRDTLTAPSSEALQLGNDPMNAFSPLLSIYYLVREKQERERTDNVLPSSSREKLREKEREREKEKEKERDRESDRSREKESEAMPELAPPQAAHTNAAAYEMPGEPTGGRSRPRARTHGEDDAPETTKTGHLAPPDARPEPKEKKEGTAAGLLRRFSTRKRREPERSEKDRSHPPVVQVHQPAEGAALGPKKSFSIRRSRRDRDENGDSGDPIRSGGSQPAHRELLSPPMSAGGARDGRRGGLGRSTSVNSGDVRRHQSTRIAKDPPATSGSDQSVLTEQPGSSRRPHGHSRSVSMRAKSIGHARRDSVQQRRQQRRDATHDNDVLEETDLENEHSGQSTERLDDSELAKPVFLKGLFSVSTTSGKSVPAIRSDIRRVLKQLNVDFVEIKGGFSCRHAPSIDLNKVHDPPMSPGANPQSKRRFSFGGLRRGEGERDEVRDFERPPTTPRTPGKSDRDRERDRDRDRSYSNSETSVDSIPRRTGGQSRRAPGETSTQVQSDLGGSMVLEFEIFIVKVPLLSMHGIQFKRLTGNTWQYKSMADQILKELRL